MEESLSIVQEMFPMNEAKLRTYSALSFAYIGDAVYELIIRTVIASRGNMKPNKYHQHVIEYVNARGQVRIMEKIRPHLTEEENVIFRRGKNAKPPTCAKNQSLHDYHIATGFEALVGYLYLGGQMRRLMELLDIGLQEEEVCHTKKIQS